MVCPSPSRWRRVDSGPTFPGEDFLQANTRPSAPLVRVSGRERKDPDLFGLPNRSFGAVRGELGVSRVTTRTGIPVQRFPR